MVLGVFIAVGNRNIVVVVIDVTTRPHVPRMSVDTRDR